jgi:hypothetical protein
MAYTDGNSVTITPEIGFTLSNPPGLADAGWPCVVAVAVKGGEGLGALDQLWTLGRTSGTGNHWLTCYNVTSLSGLTEESSLSFESRAGPGGSATAAFTPTSVLFQDEWLIVVFRATDATTWEFSAGGGPVTDISPETSSGTPSGLVELQFLHRLETQFFADDVTGWVAFWGSTNHANISDADMVAISGGTDAPTVHTPDAFIWFKDNVAYVDEAAETTATVVGAGSIAEADGDNPPGWPPSAGVTIAVPAGALSIASEAPVIVVTSGGVNLGLGVVTFTELQPQLVQTHNHIRAPPAVATAFTGLQPAITVTQALSPGVGSATLTGLQPSAEIDHIRQVSVGSLALTGLQPEIHVGEKIIVTPGAGSISLTVTDAEFINSTDMRLILTGHAVTLATGQAEIVEIPAAGTLALTGYAPTLTYSWVVRPDAGALALAGLAPVGDNTLLIVLPGAGSASFTTLQPAIELTGLHTAKPGAASLSLTGRMVEVVRASPNAPTIALTGYAPSIQIANSGVSITNPNAISVPSNYEICDRTGFRVRRGQLKETWDGLKVRRKSWEPRHPQDFVRGRAEKPKGSTRPEQEDRFIEDEITPDDL